MFAVLLIIVACSIVFTDVTRRHISNHQVITVAMLSLVISGFTAFAPLACLLALITGLVLFAAGAFAGGDIKLMLAFLPAIQLQWWSLVLMMVAIIGGVMALGYLGYGWINNRMQAVRERGLPYGVPIVIAGFGGVLLSAG
ncbi:prepilin peptidase [Endozoicomonas sp.]|uniref:prepilin peptidase n=1 Tax=Endozoicomonas sp. TaxID=1892382 RepID=UPI0028880610|nr:hypothetical protein [Endozoicomonas sp.]